MKIEIQDNIKQLENRLGYHEYYNGELKDDIENITKQNSKTTAILDKRVERHIHKAKEHVEHVLKKLKGSH